jgi:hypothetical protein
MRGRIAAPTGDLGGHRLGRARSAIENRDPRAGGSEGPARRGADPIPSAGDEGNFPGKILGHCGLS